MAFVTQQRLVSGSVSVHVKHSYCNADPRYKNRGGGALSAISFIERAPPLSNSLKAIYYLAHLCTCILYLVFCNIVFFQIIYPVYVV